MLTSRLGTVPVGCSPGPEQVWAEAPLVPDLGTWGPSSSLSASDASPGRKKWQADQRALRLLAGRRTILEIPPSPPSGAADGESPDSADVRAVKPELQENGPMTELTAEEARALRGWLNTHQFQTVSSIGGDSAPFGDRQEVWERDGTLIHLTRDRGQWWYDLSRRSTNVWLDI